MSKLFKVRLYGDSLALPREGAVAAEERYLYSLQSWWLQQDSIARIDGLDRSKASNTIVQLTDWLRHDNAYFGTDTDVIILHCGVCDCAPRPVPPWLREVISKLPNFLREPIISFLHNQRALLLKLGSSWRVVPPHLFEVLIFKWLRTSIQKAKRTYVINIAPTNAKTESHSPGLTASINLYNQIIKRCVERIATENLFLIDMHAFISCQPEGIDHYILPEDGHHLTAKAHRAYSEAIIEHEKSFFEENP